MSQLINTEGPTYSIYLSGRISGDPNYLEKFAVVTKVLRTAYPAARIFNPAWEFLEISKKLKESGISEEAGHEILVDMCLKIMEYYEAIAIMPDWNDSAGAVTELKAAMKNGMKIIKVPEEWMP